MPTDNGYSNQKKKGLAQFETVHNLGSGSYGKVIAPKSLYEITASSAIVAVTDIKGPNGQVEYWNIELTAHGASVGNIFRINAGALINSEYEIIQVINANNFYILPITDIKPAALDTGAIMGWVTQKLASDGSINVTTTTAPTSYNLDGNPQTVEQDTVTRANNRALPNLNFIIKDGVQVPITKDTVLPSNTVGMPVELVAASGTSINITAGDINVQLSDQGVNFDSLRVGDGSGNYVAINASLEMQVRDDDANTSLASIDSKLPAALGQQAEAASLSVTLSTENETVLNAILTEVGGINTDTPPLVGGRVPVDGSGVTQPISATSLPLPTGAATETTLSTLLTETSIINSKLSNNYGNAVTALRTASQIGNTTGSADFDSGNSTAQTLRVIPATDSNLTKAAQLPTALGQTTSANSLAVVISSDQSAIPVTQTALTATYQEDLTVTDASAETFTAPAGAKWCKIQADETNTGNMRVKIGGTATTTSGIQFQPGRSEDYQAVGNISYIMETGFTGKIYVQFGA